MVAKVFKLQQDVWLPCFQCPHELRHKLIVRCPFKPTIVMMADRPAQFYGPNNVQDPTDPPVTQTRATPCSNW